MYNNKYYVQYTDTCKIELNPNCGHWIFSEIICVCVRVSKGLVATEKEKQVDITLLFVHHTK